MAAGSFNNYESEFKSYSQNLCKFFRKCNPEMVELLPLELQEDLDYVKSLLIEFHEKTGSEIAKELVSVWPEPAKKFIKVRT